MTHAFPALESTKTHTHSNHKYNSIQSLFVLPIIVGQDPHWGALLLFDSCQINSQQLSSFAGKEWVSPVQE